MIRDGLAWLKDMATAHLNPPAEVLETARAQQAVPYPPPAPELARTPPVKAARAAVDAVPPRPQLRHTVPPQQSGTFRGPEFGCVGLCIGGTCAVCDGLAYEITAARRIRVPAIREVREGSLLRRINTLRGNRS